MLKLIFLRHGETDSNVRGTYLGWTDIPLNATGQAQALRAAEKIVCNKPDLILSSPLSRAVQTAQAVTALLPGMEIVQVHALMERNFGEWDDLTRHEIEARWPEEYRQYGEVWKTFRVPGGESSQDQYDRLSAWLDGFVEEHRRSGRTVLIVTHLGCVRKALAHLLGMGMDGSWRFRVENCARAEITINDEG